MKRLLCKLTGGHRYADANMVITEINHYTDTVKIRNYCVKCDRPYEVQFSYSCMFGRVDEEIARRRSEKGGA